MKLGNYCYCKRSLFISQQGKSFIEMQLVYLILTFLRIIITLYVIVSKQMKKGHLFQRNKENSININWLSHIRKPWKIVTSSNNSQSVRKAELVCDILLRNLKTWKSIEIMLLVVYNNVLKSSWSASICWCDSVEIKLELFFWILRYNFI